MLTTSDGVALLTLAAGRANAMSAEFLETLDSLLEELERSDALAAVITGYDRFFSAGLALPTLIELDRPAMKRFIERFSQVMMRVYAQKLPVVAAINGHAIAGGCVLALMCDLRLMAEGDFKIGLNEVQLGIGLPSVVIESLRFLPPSSLLPLALEGQLVSPSRARELGLVDEVVSNLLPRALERAKSLASAPGLSQVKAALRRPALDAMKRHDEIESWLDTWFSPPARERLTKAVAQLIHR